MSDYRDFKKNYAAEIEPGLISNKNHSLALLSNSVVEYLKNIKFKNCILVANQIKAVGKTLTVFNIALILSHLYKKKTLIVDMDPEGKLSELFAWLNERENEDEVEKSEEKLIKLLTNPAALDADNYESYVKKSSKNPYLHIVNAPLTLRDFEFQLMALKDGEHRLYFPVKKLSDEYDYILIDSNSSTNILSINAYIAADWILVPVRYGVSNPIRAIKSLSFFVESLNQRWSSDVKLLGYHYTMCPKDAVINDNTEATNHSDNIERLKTRISFSNQLESLLKALMKDFDNNIEKYMRSVIFGEYKKFTAELVDRVELV